MRLDRSVTMLLSLLPRPRRSRIPVFMYHSISENRSSVSHPYFETVTRPPVFRRHLELLRDAGYSVIKLDSLAAAATPADAPGKRLAAITFDDGYDDFYTNALPVLQSFGFTATVFLPTGYIGAIGPGLEGRSHLSWERIREMHAAGIEFGSHTVTHPRLVEAPESEIIRQIRDSKTAIEQAIGSGVSGFAYPYRFPEENAGLVSLLRRTLKEAGYRYGVCTTIGRFDRDDDRFFIKRLPANDFDDDAFFLAKCAGAYDWVHGPQRLKKRMASWLHR